MASEDQGQESVERSKNYYFWAPPIFLIIILCCFIIYLLIPGNLIYPHIEPNVSDKVVVSDAAKKELIESLETQIADLENMSANAICTDEGLMLPDNQTMLFPPKINSDIDGPTDFSILPPARKLTDPNAAAEEGSSLASLLEIQQKQRVLVSNRQNHSQSAGNFEIFYWPGAEHNLHCLIRKVPKY